MLNSHHRSKAPGCIGETEADTGGRNRLRGDDVPPTHFEHIRGLTDPAVCLAEDVGDENEIVRNGWL